MDKQPREQPQSVDRPQSKAVSSRTIKWHASSVPHFRYQRDVIMSTFASELQNALNTGNGVYAMGGEYDENLLRLRQLLDQPDSLRKRIVLRILEHRATLWVHDNHPGKTVTGAIDWASVPWEQIITGLLEVLLMILPFIL